jgi:hypothetical protein
MVARPVRMRLQRKYPTVPDRRTTVHAANNKSTQTGIVIFCPNAFYPKTRLSSAPDVRLYSFDLRIGKGRPSGQ